MGMTKGSKMNKMSFEKKLEIVNKHYVDGKTFRELSNSYQVSYSAIRAWCLDYDVNGEKALKKEQGKGMKGHKANTHRSNSIDPRDREIARLKKALKQAEMRETIAKKFNEAMENLQKELSSKK